MTTVLELAREWAKPIRVLVAESDAAQTDALAACLVTYNVDITRAASTGEALAEIDRSKFDIAFIDLLLQGQPGTPIVLALRAVGVPVVIMTGCLDYKLVDEAYKSGVVAFLRKPLDTAGQNVGDVLRLFNLRVGPKAVPPTVVVDGTVASDTYQALERACP